jgi:hypothetical protein
VPCIANREGEDRSPAEHREEFRREGDFRRAQRQEGENINPALRGGGGNPRFHDNQFGHDMGQSGANRNTGYGDQFRGGVQGNRAGNFGGGFKRGRDDREGVVEIRDFDL